jgi:hypothetical protein
VISARRRPHAAACALALFALNAFMIWPLFGVEYLRHLFSIEGTFIAIARAILEHRAWGTWWPWWGAGMPFEYTYLPGLPAATALVSRITGWSAAGSYHWVTALAYCLGPVMVFLLVWRMSSRWVPAAIAGLAFSLVSPATLLVPIVRQDAGGIASPQRLRALVYYGGGPEVATLALVSLAILLFHAALGKRRAWLYALAGASAAAVALTNAFGAAFLVLALACLAVASAAGCRRRWCALRRGDRRRQVATIAGLPVRCSPSGLSRRCSRRRCTCPGTGGSPTCGSSCFSGSF